MKRRTAKIALVMALAAVLGVLTTALPQRVAAEEAVKLSLSSDKDAYAAGESATFTLTVVNSGSAVAQNATYTVELPKGFEPTEGQRLTGSLGDLEPGETQVIEISAKTTAATAGSNGGGAASTEENTRADNQDSDKNQTPDEKNLPTTSDAAAWTLPLAVVLAAGGVAAIIAAKRLRKGAFTVLLVAGVAASMALVGPAPAYAETIQHTASATRTVTIDGKELTAKAQLTYLMDDGSTTEEPADPENPEDPGTDEPAEPGEQMLTRAEWIHRLLAATEEDPIAYAEDPFDDVAGHAYEQDILTAYALGILPDNSDAFEPDAAATRDFAFATATLHAGFADTGSALGTADAAESSYPSLLAVAVDEGIAQPDASNKLYPKQGLTQDVADAVSAQVADLRTVEEIPGGEPVMEAVLQDDVIALSDYELQPDGSILVDEADLEQAVAARPAAASTNSVARAVPTLQVGQKIVVRGNENDLEGEAGTVASFEPVARGLYRIDVNQTDDPGFVYREITIRKKDAKGISGDFEPVDGVQVTSSSETAAASASSRKTTLEAIDFDIADLKIEAVGTLKGKLHLVPSVDVDFKWSAGSIKKCKVVADLDGYLDVNFDIQPIEDTPVDLLKEPLTLNIGYGFNIAFMPKLVVGASGEVSLRVDIDQRVGTQYKNGHFQKLNGGKGFSVPDDKEPSLNANLKLGVRPVVSIRLTKIDLCDVDVEVGVNADGVWTPDVDRPVSCLDFSAYVYGKLGVGQNTPWMQKVGLELPTFDFWKESTSPLHWHYHFEDGKRTPNDKCTVGDGAVLPENREPTSSDNFLYDVIDNKVYIMGYVGKDASIMIPARIDGKNVVSVNLLGGEYPEGRAVREVSLQKGSKVRDFYTGEYWAQAIDLQELDLSASKKLETVCVGDNGGSDLTEMDLGEGANLKELRVNGFLEELDISDYNALEEVDLSWNDLTKLTVGKLPNLKSLDVNNNQLKKLNVSGCPKLEELDCSYNLLTALDVSACPELVTLSCGYGKFNAKTLEKLTLNNPKLRSLDADLTKLTELDLSSCGNIETVDAQLSELTSIDLTGCKNLKSLWINSNDIGAIDLSDCVSLEELCCGANSLGTLDVSACKNLRVLDCWGCDLDQLDVSGNAKLEELDCGHNNLTELDISANPNLVTLKCAENPIEDTSALEEWMAVDGHTGELPESAPNEDAPVETDGAAEVEALSLDAAGADESVDSQALTNDSAGAETSNEDAAADLMAKQSGQPEDAQRDGNTFDAEETELPLAA